MKNEITRTREQGTKVTRSKSPEEKISAIRRVVEECQYAKIDGIMVDLFSASAIISVYNAIGDENKVKFASMPIQRMKTIAFKLCA